MRTYRRIACLVLVSMASLTRPLVASAQDGSAFPDFQMPSLGVLQGIGMPTISQYPGGITIVVPGLTNITITDPNGVFTSPQAGQPSVPPVAPQPALPGVPPAPGAIQPGGSGRVVGVFAGITAYPSGSLENCADDARNLANAFAQAGIIQQSDAIVLTDHLASRAGIAAAVQRLGASLRQGDTLVFFFSGHGDHQPDTNGDEQDGMDETIVLIDGSMTDDELVGLLQQSGANDFVALDTCYAGGFQADVARIPYSVGFYSSGETETSSVASEFGAGGYLSHFLRTGIEQSRGRQLQVWNLQQHIQQGYMTSGANGRQQLVVGVGQGNSMQTVLFDPTPRNPSALASLRSLWLRTFA
jgi:hypothetical protein